MDDAAANAIASLPAIDELGSEHLQELHRMTELGRISAHLLHEISSPLTAAILHLEHGGTESSGIRRAKHSMHILQRYVEAARQQVRLSSRSVAFYLRPQLSDLRRIMHPLAQQAGVHLYIQRGQDCQLYGDPVKLQQIIANLIKNALEACEELPAEDAGRRVRVTFTARHGWLSIRVRDGGVGIPEDALTRVFEPFYTTKHSNRHGLGIGLAMIKRYVERDFSGHITVNSSSEAGTCFCVKIPVISH